MAVAKLSPVRMTQSSSVSVYLLVALRRIRSEDAGLLAMLLLEVVGRGAEVEVVLPVPTTVLWRRL